MLPTEGYYLLRPLDVRLLAVLRDQAHWIPPRTVPALFLRKLVDRVALLVQHLVGHAALVLRLGLRLGIWVLQQRGRNISNSTSPALAALLPTALEGPAQLSAAPQAHCCTPAATGCGRTACRLARPAGLDRRRDQGVQVGVRLRGDVAVRRGVHSVVAIVSTWCLAAEVHHLVLRVLQ